MSTEFDKAVGDTSVDAAEDLYFAYGPDMDPAVLRSRGGTPDAVGVARLADHRLAFYGHSAIWDSGLETVVAAAGEDVWGVVYRLGASAWDRLDSWMDARLDGGGPYFHYPVDVVEPSGKIRSVRLFKKDLLGEPRTPSLEYLEHVIAGGGLQGLPLAYVDKLRRLVARKASYPVPRSGNPNRGEFSSLDCGSCHDAEPEVEIDLEEAAS